KSICVTKSRSYYAVWPRQQAWSRRCLKVVGEALRARMTLHGVCAACAADVADGSEPLMRSACRVYGNRRQDERSHVWEHERATDACRTSACQRVTDASRPSPGSALR